MSEHAKPAQGHEGSGGHDEAHGHPDSFYIKIWGILVVLLVLSMVGPFIGEATGIIWITLITAFGIAFVKAWLVIKNFMHLTVEKPIAWYILISCLVFMVLFFAGVGADVMNHEGQNWVNYAAQNEVKRGLAAGSGHGDEGAEHGEGAGHDEGAAPAEGGH